jgi:hypothetical protein
MKKRILYSVLVLFLLTDLAYSFAQHLSQPMDGDMANNIVPGSAVAPVLKSPFGLGVITAHQTYLNPNRFFAHYTMKKYFEVTPLFLQRFVEPIDSIYLSCALIKILTQLALIILLSIAITGSLNFFKLDLIIAAALITPLFQSEGYQSYMGIIDRSTTYTFFYALPVLFLLFYLTPLVLQYYHEKKPVPRFLIYLLWIPLAIFISLSGPLNPGIVLIFSILLFANSFITNYIYSNHNKFIKRVQLSISAIPGGYWFYLVPISLFSLYSLYIGRNNSTDIHLPLKELYSRIPAGIYYPLTKKLGFPVLLFIISMNQIIISRYFKTKEGKRITSVVKWIGIFSLFYILLLPLGGSRDYRPNVLRYDTYLPITLSLVFIFGLSTLFLFKNLTSGHRKWYIPVICSAMLFFTINDEPHFDKNKCERAALKEISESKSLIVPIKCDCNILSWGQIKRPQESQLNSELLYMWNVTKVRKLYYNE